MSKTVVKNPCKVITGPKTIFSYLNVNEPKVRTSTSPRFPWEAVPRSTAFR